MRPFVRATHLTFTLDCPDAVKLAEFYAGLLGWSARPSDDDFGWVDVVPPAGESPGFSLACQQIENYRPPTWPEGDTPQQGHLDIYVDSIVEAGPLAEAAGAVRDAFQPATDGTFVIYRDPAGHPFCLCEES